MLNTIVLIIPILFLIVALEWYIAYRHNKKSYTLGNFAMNITIGAMDQVASLFYFTALYFVLQFVYSNYHFMELSEAWYIWLLAYVVIDFLSYWYHRLSHRINILWAGHVTHHSSEHFNFSNGFRTSFFQGVNRILFWSVLPLFGFSPLMLVIILKVSGLYDFLLHTEYIPKLGFLEKFLITPSQHRVHHGRNDIYIDKNYGSTFNIWDKMFGTFQEETEQVEYGIKGDYVDNNPFMAIGYYFNYIWKSMQTQKGVVNKLRILFIAPDQTPKPERTKKRLWPLAPELNIPEMKNYAVVQIALMVPAMILMLLFKDFLSTWQFALYAAVGISSISAGAMILNENISNVFPKVETWRLVIAIICVLTLFIRTEQLHALGVVFALLMILVQFITIKTRRELANDNS